MIDQQDRLFLLKRSDDRVWGLPGGAIETRERIEDRAKREIGEEHISKLERYLYLAFSQHPNCTISIPMEMKSITSVLLIFPTIGTVK